MDKPPKIPAQSTSFTQQVFARLGFFATFKGKAKNGQPALRRGRAAAQESLAHVKAMEVDTLGLKDLELLCVFSFLLPEDQQQEVAALTEQVYKAASCKAQPSKKAASSSKSKANKPSQASMASHISEAAAMFK